MLQMGSLRQKVHRTAAWLALATVVAQGLLIPSSKAYGAEERPHPSVPVILVHSAGSGPWVWGVPRGGHRVSSAGGGDIPGRGFVSFLVSKGYEPGRSLFWLDYSAASGTDPAIVARDWLAPYVAGVLAATGSHSVDIVSHGTGALTARYYLEYFGGAERVRTLAMIAPPNRGSFAASYFRLLGSMAAQDRFRRLEGLGRGQVVDEGVLTAPFLEETFYVAQAAHGFFEPLFGRFSASTLFLRRPSQRSDIESFESWLARNQPRLYRLAFTAAGKPPDQTPAHGIGFTAGEQLSRAYFHALALAVARNNYRNLTPWTEVLADGWEEDLSSLVDMKRDWRTAAAEFAMRRLLRLAEEVARRAGITYGRQALVAAVRVLSSQPPDAPAISAQIEEVIRPGSPLWNGPDALTGNARLAGLNARDAKQRFGRRTRFVTVVGVMPNLWPGFLGQRGANDLFTEARSALLPPGPMDASLLYSSLLGSSRDRLPWQRTVQDYVFRHLDPLSPVGERHSLTAGVLGLKSGQRDGADAVADAAPPSGGRSSVLWRRGGMAALTLTEPYTLALDFSQVQAGGPAAASALVTAPPAGAMDGIQLSLKVSPPSDLPKGAALFAFIASLSQGQPRLLASSRVSEEGRLVLPLTNLLANAYGTAYYIGFRLLPDQAISASPGILRQGRTWRTNYEVSIEKADRWPDQYREQLLARRSQIQGTEPVRERPPLGVEPGASRREGNSRPGPGGGHSGKGPGNGGAGGGATRSWEPGSGAAGDAGPTAGRAGIRGGAATKRASEKDGNMPEIVVTYHNKRTTDKEEDRTYHVRWEWDFGDGTSFEDADPSHVVSRVEHQFDEGEYLVRARSWSNKGTLLRELRWDVRVGPEGAKAVFKTGAEKGLETFAQRAQPHVLGPPDNGSSIVFTAESIREPYPEIAIQGPGTWVTGRQARFSLRVSVPEVKFLKSWTADFYPAEEFLVRWRRPGVFTVRAAVRITLRYGLPEGELTLRNTYVITRDVQVMATSVTG